METQLAVALADGFQHDTHAVTKVVAHDAPHEKKREEDADGRENQVEVVDVRHRERLVDQTRGEVQQVFDDDGCRCPKDTDYHAENQHHGLVFEVPLEEPPAPRNDI